jgi:hypothetical protein
MRCFGRFFAGDLPARMSELREAFVKSIVARRAFDVLFINQFCDRNIRKIRVGHVFGPVGKSAAQAFGQNVIFFRRVVPHFSQSYFSSIFKTCSMTIPPELGGGIVIISCRDICRAGEFFLSRGW